LAQFVEDVQNSILQGESEFEIEEVTLEAVIDTTMTVVKHLQVSILSRESDSETFSIVQPFNFALVFEDSGSETLLLQAVPIEVRSTSTAIAPATTLAAQQGRALLQL
jgi:hypothetical protein